MNASTPALSLEDIIPHVPVPCLSEQLEQDKKNVQHTQAFLRKHPGAFLAPSLSAWIALAKHANVEAVPIAPLTSISREAFFFALSADKNRSETERAVLEDFHAQWREVAQKIKQTTTAMARWDVCAPLGLKRHMANPNPDGQSPGFSFEDFAPESDPRAYDILYETHTEQFDIWSRPWIRAVSVKGYPVEFRVFIKDSQVIGVANYYVQRPLSEHDPRVNAWTQRCVQLSKQLLAHIRTVGAYPWMPRFERAGFATDKGQIHATLDFLISAESGEPVFLEAGPPFGAGAHPCAFEPHITQGLPIHGVAL